MNSHSISVNVGRAKNIRKTIIWQRHQSLSGQFIPSAVTQAKRLFDVLAAGLGLLLVLPLFPLIALAIRAESQGPVFFKQLRVGQSLPDRTDVFMMIKFRTMAQDAEKQSGPTLAQKNDARITRVGNFLRKTRLDELPQFINVLRGDMSLIGPRPERPSFCRRLEQQIPYFTDRTYGVKPGITGLSQVHQGYDECLDDVKNKLGYDLSYSLSLTSVYNWIKADIGIVFATIKVMVLGRGQ
ncbi:sugar transferase [Bacterioplanoides sp.]|uniref:sugar transferase n=1 Tax=Bacterioplanoides sp. TaxID=2066072 RepID=UPI003B000FA6